MSDDTDKQATIKQMDCYTAPFVSLLLSRDEYVKLLSYINKSKVKTLATVLPNPNLIDATDSNPGPEDSLAAFEPSVTRIIRSNARLFGKIYLLLLTSKNLRQFWQDKSLTTLLTKSSLKDSTSARIALIIASISVSYKGFYKLLLHLRPYFTRWLTFLQKEEQKIPIPKSLWIESHTFTPLVAGLLSSSLFKFFPREFERDVIALYVFMRTGEMLFNYLDDMGFLAMKPKLLGSWTLFPFAFSQMFHSFFFNPETNPGFVKSALSTLSADFFPARPSGLAAGSSWPTTERFVEGIAQTAKHNYPKFQSKLMFPDSAKFPDYLDAVQPVVTRAHPAIGTMTGAMMHPFEPSTFRAFTEIALKKYSSIGKYVFALYLIQGFMANSKKEEKAPKVMIVLRAMAKSLRTTTFIVMTTVSAFAGIEIAQRIFNPKFLPMHRFKFIGFMAGLWAFINQVDGRGRYIFAARAGLLSYWRVLIKDKRIKPTRNFDVYLFMASFAVMMTLFDRSPEAVSGPSVRKVLSWIKNDEFKDPVKYEK